MSTITTVFFKALTSLLVANKVFYAQKMPFYAVAKGRTSGIFMTWADCEAQVKGFSGARYKKFDTVVAAQEFINATANHNILPQKKYNNHKPPNASNNNLKRSYSKSSNNQKLYQPPSTSQNKSRKDQENDDESDTFSDGSDDLNTILSKQLDDVEKRLKGFGKNVDKIIKKSTKDSSRRAIMIEPPQAKRRKSSGGSDFKMDNDGYVEVYTDGACSANGRSGARAGLGVYWGEGHPLNVSEPVSGRATNNCGEIQAATKAIKQALQNGVQKLSINTDSQFLINSVTKWIPGRFLK